MTALAGGPPQAGRLHPKPEARRRRDACTTAAARALWRPHMSVQAVSRLAALLTLDVDTLRDYVPRFADDDEDQEEDLNEANRAHLAYLWRNQLTDEEQILVTAGDMNAILVYLAAGLERPVNGESTGSSGGGSGGGG